MEPRFRFRLYLLTAIILVGVGILLTRLYRYQIEDQEYYRKLIPGETSITIRDPGIRGTIVDRNGELLAKNVRNYELVLNLEEIHNDWERQHMKQRPGQRKIGMTVPTAKRSREIVRIVKDAIVPRLKKHGIEVNYSSEALQTHYVTHGGLVPFTFPVDLTYEHFARLAEHNLEMAGVYVTVRPRREYPYGTLACHILGYLKQWEKGDIPDSTREEYDHYLGDAEGAAGVEVTMDQYLQGAPGRRVLRKNEKGRILGEELDKRVPPDQGNQVVLTIDARVQYLVENILRRDNVGRAAAVVIEVNTGEVIAMASVPNYNPNEFIPSISRSKWKDYRTNKAKPLINRSISSFTPGSTYKLPTAVAGCMHGMTSFNHRCIGRLSFGSKGRLKIACWKTVGHGSLILSTAIQRSCNPYFMQLANELGTQKMTDTFRMLNLGRPTGISLPAEDQGIVPGSAWWRRVYRPGQRMTPARLAMLAIGQDDSEATPLQMAAMVACIANGGEYYRPRIIKRVVDPKKGVVLSDIPELKVDLLTKGMNAAQLEEVRYGMWKAANKVGGTARRASLENIEVGAKTGTAQTTDFGRKSHNAWTVAFAPYEEPKYAVAVVVQNGKSGGKVAGPLVHLIFRGLFAADSGHPLPLNRMGEVPGNFDPIEETSPLEGDLLSLAIDEEGETGEEASDAQSSDAPVKVKPRTLLLPSITPDADTGTSTNPGSRPPNR
ncbi:MAG: penicillin-binding transpeptidase domain-containing protein [Roseibacillus sp.]|nr:penicillin-binding transpeptidase domain-containing protein [Roseibacillus sp.]